MANAKKKFYAVARGQVPGIYTQWFGANGAEVQVKGFPKPRYKGFPTREEAEQWLAEITAGGETSTSGAGAATSSSTASTFTPTGDEIIMYTDGSSLNNPGPGGYGVVIMDGDKRTELSAGFRRTTNNRMELLGCIEGLKSLKQGSKVILHSDSQYVVKGITLGWAKKWRANGWNRGKSGPAENADLWQILLELCDTHDVHFVWVKGHAGNVENERCDRLANEQSAKSDLPPDENYEAGKTTLSRGLF